MVTIFLSGFVEYYTFLRGIVEILAYGCLGGTLFLLFSQKKTMFVSNKDEFNYVFVFKELINKHVYENPKLYLTNARYIDLPLDEFTKYNLNHRKVRRILVHTILECYRTYPDGKRMLLKKLYEDLDLDLFAIVDLDRGSAVVSTIAELSDMGIMVERDRIIKFLTHRHVEVRRAARIYLLHSLKFSPVVSQNS